jgi:hypothetical protein
MEKIVPLPWAVATVLAVLIIVGVVIWHRQSAQQAVPTGPHNVYEEYGARGLAGAPGGGPGALPAGPH